MNNQWVSVYDIAIYLGVKRDTIYKWIGERGLPAHKIGRLWKFQKDEVDDWIKSAQRVERKHSVQ